MSNIKGTKYDSIRGYYGKAAEADIRAYLDIENIPYETTHQWCERIGIPWSSTIDRINGDIIVMRKYWFDCKRNSITERSMDDFDGVGYFLQNHFLSKCFFIPKETLRKLRPQLIEELESVQSKELALKYKTLKNYKFLTLEEFVQKFLKPLVPKYHDYLKKKHSEVS